MMKWFVAMVMLVSVSLVSVDPAEAGRRYRRGNFWGGFAAGALASALLAPRVVVAPPVVVVAPPVYAPRRIWVPGDYVVRYKPCGTPYRVWRRGYYRGGY